MTVKTLGVVAGNRDFPILVAKEAKRQGCRIVVVAIHEITSTEISSYADKVMWIGLGQLGRLIDFFKQEKVDHILMAGQIPHRLVFKAMKFDLRGMKFISRRKNWNAVNILGNVLKELEDEGFQWIDSTHYLCSQLADEGVLSKKGPTKQQLDSVERGWQIAKGLANYDIGQTIVVKNGVVIAVEAMEGTDETIKRAGDLAGKGTVVIKVARTYQDLRYDVPVVGEDTLNSMREGHSNVLVVEAGKTILLYKDQFIKKADQLGLVVIGKT